MRLIDADALERSMNERHRTLVQLNGEYDHYVAGYGDAICEVEDIPTIDAEPVRHGRWIKFVYDTRWVKCSECKCNWERRIVEECNMNYCPNCGAKMDGGAEK